MKTFVLIQRENQQHPFWWEKEGEGLFRNISGGFIYAQLDKYEILQEVAAESFEELDWTITRFGKVKGYINGWLSPSGDWFPCCEEDHDDVAQFIIKKDSVEMEEQGWSKVSAGEAFSPYSLKLRIDRPFTEMQKAFLRRHEISFFDDDNVDREAVKSIDGF